ncbi:MAG: trypsin-like peptidase domain-containing protein [Bryobacterales bacterium]|nr:trypsin-like peptidase domain-containing protein [Bryobacterales bacterium]
MTELVSAQSAGGSLLLLNGRQQSAAYNGIGRLRRGNGNCTATLLKVASEAPPGAPAYVLTAGHCIEEQADPNAVYANRPEEGFEFVLNWFIDSQQQQRVIPVRRVTYSTMKGQDLAILELAASHDELAAAGFRALEIAATGPANGIEVEAVHAPVSNVPEDERFLRISTCRLEGTANLVEYHWFFYDTWKNRCADIWGGSSGSPLLDRGTGQILAVTNTTTSGPSARGGNWDCFAGRPCEVTRDGARVVESMNYAIPVHGLRQCFNAAGVFSLNQRSCPLDPGLQWSVNGWPGRIVRNPDRDGRPVPANLTLSGNTYQFFRYKIGPEGRIDCRDIAGYSNVFSIKESNRINQNLPQGPGRQYACILGGNSPTYDATWQDPRFATMLFTTVDLEPPAGYADLLNFDQSDGLYSFRLLISNPDISNYRFKLGPASEIDCASPRDYVTYRRTPLEAPVSPVHRMCVIPADEVGNEGAVVEYLFSDPQIFPNGFRHPGTGAPGPVAPGQIVSIEGIGFNGRITVQIKDSTGRSLAVPIQSSDRHNLVVRIPRETAIGAASVEVTREDGRSTSRSVRVEPVSPGIFRVRAGGLRVAVGNLVRLAGGLQTRIATANCQPDGVTCAANRIPTGSPADAMALELLGTGMRAIDAPERLGVTLNGLALKVRSVVPYAGLDGAEQIDLDLPRDFRTSAYGLLEFYLDGKPFSSAVIFFEQ